MRECQNFYKDKCEDSWHVYFKDLFKTIATILLFQTLPLASLLKQRRGGEVQELNEPKQTYGPDAVEGDPYLNLKCEVFIEIFDDHYQVWQLYTECLLGVSRTCDIGCAAMRGKHELRNK